MSTNQALEQKWTAEAIKALRQRYGPKESRDAFAERINSSVAAVRFWEIGRGVPNGPTLRLFEYMEQELDMFARMPQLAAK